MNKYTVIIRKTLETEVAIEAENEFEAVEQAKEDYKKGKITVNEDTTLNGIEVDFRTYDSNDENYYVESTPLIY